MTTEVRLTKDKKRVIGKSEHTKFSKQIGGKEHSQRKTSKHVTRRK